MTIRLSKETRGAVVVDDSEDAQSALRRMYAPTASEYFEKLRIDAQDERVVATPPTYPNPILIEREMRERNQREAIETARLAEIERLKARDEYEANKAKKAELDTAVPATPTNKPTGHWPWGDHHTELLGHLEAAALRFWVNYDPKDKSTAPTNDQIYDWLRERGVSKNMAGAMATILRLDDLPNGPRT